MSPGAGLWALLRIPDFDLILMSSLVASAELCVRKDSVSHWVDNLFC